MTNFNRDGSPLVWTVITLAVLIVLAIRLQAHAAQIEIGAGIAHASTNGNGTWYQEGFPHTLSLTQPVAEIGLTGRITPHMAWHVDAVSLGSYSVNSEDVLPDANYSATSPTHCNGPCNPFANFIGSGRLYGLQALLSRSTGGAWRFGIEAGPFLYHETWRLDVPNWYASDGTHYDIQTYGSQWALGAVVGATVQHGPWTLALRYYADSKGFSGHVGNWPPLWSGQTVAILSYRFGGAL